jgi:hypothetical protein
MSKVFEKIKEEFHALLPPTIFFFITLHLIALIRILMLKGTGITLGTSVSVTIAALVLGKTVLIADMLPFINRYPDKPLIYNIAWKTVLYVLVSIVIHYLERLIDFWKEAGGFIAANEKLWMEMIWPHFLAIQILLMMLILVYCTMRELVRLMGRENMRQIFFGPV